MKYRIVEKQNKFGSTFHIQYAWMRFPYVITFWSDLSYSYNDIQSAKNLIDRVVEQHRLDKIKPKIIYHKYP